MSTEIFESHNSEVLNPQVKEVLNINKVEKYKKRNIALNYSERKLLLSVGDILCIVLALFVALTLRPANPIQEVSIWASLGWISILGVLWLSFSALLNLYSMRMLTQAKSSALVAGFAGLVTSVTFLIIPYVTPSFPESRFELLIFPIISTISVSAWRFLYVFVFAQSRFCHRVLVVGAGSSGKTLVQTLSALSYNKTHSFQGTGYEILGFIDDDPDKQNLQYMGTPVIGTRQNLLSLVKQLHVDEIVIAITNTGTMQPELFYSLLACREMGLAITSMPMVYESLTGRVSWNHAGQSFHVVLPQHQSSTKRLYLAARRLIDIAVSVPGCLFLLLVMPFVWLANRVVSPGPLFYSQERVGQNGRPFSIVKLRTMIVDAEKHTGAVWAAEKDPRITRLGHFLRKTRLDEIPQFWNIFKGEMSIIGPRPERPTFVDKLVVDYPFYRLRHAVKPGLTGWAQVKHRYTSTVADTLVKLQYDLYYIKHQNFFVDMQILLETVRVVLGFKGR